MDNSSPPIKTQKGSLGNKRIFGLSTRCEPAAENLQPSQRPWHRLKPSDTVAALKMLQGKKVAAVQLY
jgi:hypothetical protein